MNPFLTTLTVRIGDINYGNHLGHDRLITLMHEARIRFLQALGASEQYFFGAGLIMRSLNVKYLNEAFLGDELTFALRITKVEKVRFTLSYVISRGETPIAEALSEMVAFDYQQRKILALPQPVLDAVHGPAQS